MSRRVEVILLCDAHMAWHDVEVTEGVETVAVSGNQSIDLCPEHRDMAHPFFLLVSEWGATVKHRRKGPDRAPASRSTSAVAPALAPVEVDPSGTAPAATTNRRGGKRARTRRANATGASTAAVGAVTCPLCPHTADTPKNMNNHLRGRHHLSGAEVYGTVCPLCGTACDSRHGMAHHGVAGGMPALFARATAEGDPHGVIASRAEAFGKAAGV